MNACCLLLVPSLPKKSHAARFRSPDIKVCRAVCRGLSACARAPAVSHVSLASRIAITQQAGSGGSVRREQSSVIGFLPSDRHLALRASFHHPHIILVFAGFSRCLFRQASGPQSLSAPSATCATSSSAIPPSVRSFLTQLARPLSIRLLHGASRGPTHHKDRGEAWCATRMASSTTRPSENSPSPRTPPSQSASTERRSRDGQILR